MRSVVLGKDSGKVWLGDVRESLTDAVGSSIAVD